MMTKLLPISNLLPPVEFDTNQLHLRAVRTNDAEMIFNLYAKDPVASKYMSYKCSGKIEDTQAFVDLATRTWQGAAIPDKHYAWILELQSTGAPIGSVGIGSKGKFTLAGGYILAPQWWGYGYASEAWGCVVNWAKQQTEVWRIEAVHHPDNPASGKVMEKSGMKFEGRLLRHSIYPNLGEIPEDAMLYAWTRSVPTGKTR